jgi:DNA helicase-2/ATP-dependent DNA helicase PcrA
MLAAFRLADNPRDEMAWFRLLQLLPGVGPAKARRAIDALRDVDGKVPLSHGDVQRRWSSVADVLPIDAREMSRDFADALCEKSLEPVEVHAERIRRAIVPLITSSYDDAIPRLEDLGALVLACAGMVRLSDVAAEQALEPPASTGDLAGPPMVDEDWLVLSTVHSAKGLEFDAVHVIHAADGNFPSDMALGSPEGLEEERRLFYVAITRARRNLSVYVPLRYHHHRVRDDHSWAQPSRFLSESVRSTLVEIPARASSQHMTSSPSAVVINGSGIVEGQLSKLW